MFSFEGAARGEAEPPLIPSGGVVGVMKELRVSARGEVRALKVERARRSRGR